MSEIDKFLEAIAQIESAGGKYTTHKTMSSGIHKGQSAIGTYGLMPNTVNEIASTSDDEEIRALQELSPKEKKRMLESNPDLENKVARVLADRVITNQGGDLAKAAYSWNQGHNLTPDKIEKRNYEEHPYVEKFRKLAGKMNGLSIEGTPEGDQVKRSLERSPSIQTLEAMEQEKKDRREKLKGLEGSVMLTPEEDSFLKEQNFADKYGPMQMATGMSLGAPVKIAAENIVAPVAKSAFQRIQNLLRNKPMTPEEFIAKERAMNPNVREVLKDPDLIKDPGNVYQGKSNSQFEDFLRSNEDLGKQKVEEGMSQNELMNLKELTKGEEATAVAPVDIEKMREMLKNYKPNPPTISTPRNPTVEAIEQLVVPTIRRDMFGSKLQELLKGKKENE